MKRKRICEYDMKGNLENCLNRLARVNGMGNIKREVVVLARSKKIFYIRTQTKVQFSSSAPRSGPVR